MSDFKVMMLFFTAWMVAYLGCAYICYAEGYKQAVQDMARDALETK